MNEDDELDFEESDTEDSVETDVLPSEINSVNSITVKHSKTAIEKKICCQAVLNK